MLRNVSIVAAAVAVALAPSPSVAGERNQEGPDLICKREKQTTTRFTKRTCMTKEQWDAMSEQNRRNYSEMRDRPVVDTRRDF